MTSNPARPALTESRSVCEAAIMCLLVIHCKGADREFMQANLILTAKVRLSSLCDVAITPLAPEINAWFLDVP